MEGVHTQQHDDYGVHPGWVDPLGNLQQQQHPHAQPISPHGAHPQDFSHPPSHYGFVDTTAFAPHHHHSHHDSSFRLQPAPMGIHQTYLALQQHPQTHWAQQLPGTPVTTAHQHYPVPQAIAPAPSLASAPLLSPTHNTGSTNTPRRTLTDSDRRKMCLYHEANPTVKQTEIGAMFGVERSTVSKVLRQKEKYLFPDDGSRSPVKRTKGKFPDIERALSVWAKNTRKQGITLSDAMIREKARFFAISVGISESQFKANSGSWLEKFKQKNNLHSNGRGRSESDVTGIARGTTSIMDRLAAARGQVRRGTISGRDAAKMEQSNSQDSHNTTSDSADSSFVDPALAGSGSATSMSSTFGDVMGPASPASPSFFSPDSAQPSPGFHAPSGCLGLGVQQQPHRPRSQTFPTMMLDPSLLSPTPSSSPLTPKMGNHALVRPPGLASPINEISNPLASPHATPNGIPGTPLDGTPTQDEARKAMKVVMSYLKQQPLGFVEPSDYKVVNKLMGKFEINEDGVIDETGDTNMDAPGDSVEAT